MAYTDSHKGVPIVDKMECIHFPYFNKCIVLNVLFVFFTKKCLFLKHDFQTVYILLQLDHYYFEL